MLSVGNAASGSVKSPCRTRRGLKHVHSPRIQRKAQDDITIDNARTALPDHSGGRVPIQHTLFADAYQIEAELGRGKFAVVKKCRHKQNKKDYAAKILRKRRGGKDCREDIMHEVKMLEIAMDHPRLVQLVELFETQHELILVMEHVAGGELFHYVMEEGFEEKEVVRLMKQVVEALIFLHGRDIVHMDIKPQNLLLTAAPPTGDIKLCDFGFSRTITSQDDIRDIIGTPDYVAPEILSYEPLHASCDMWSVGVLVYVMLTGCSPFAGDSKMETFSNITQLNLDFPADLFDGISKPAINFIKRLLVREPEDRMTAKECLNHCWLRQDPLHQQSLIDSSLTTSTVIDSSSVTPYSSLVVSEVISSSLTTPTVIHSSMMPSVIDSSVVVPSVIDNALATPSVIDSSITTPMNPPLSSPPSSRSSIYMSADSLLEISEKRTSRCLDSSGDELDRSEDNLDQGTDTLNQDTDNLDLSTDSLEETDLLNAIQKAYLDNSIKNSALECDDLKSRLTYNIAPADSPGGCDRAAARCDLGTVPQKEHKCSVSVSRKISAGTGGCMVGNDQNSSLAGYHRAQLAQLSLDSIHDIPHVCTQEATLSVHDVTDLDIINGNDVTDRNAVRAGEVCDVQNACFHNGVMLHTNSTLISMGLERLTQCKEPSGQEHSTSVDVFKSSAHPDIVKPSVRCEGVDTGCFSESKGIQGINCETKEEFNKCLENFDDIVTDLDVIMTSTGVYVTETDVYTPTLCKHSAVSGKRSDAEDLTRVTSNNADGASYTGQSVNKKLLHVNSIDQSFDHINKVGHTFKNQVDQSSEVKSSTKSDAKQRQLDRDLTRNKCHVT